MSKKSSIEPVLVMLILVFFAAGVFMLIAAGGGAYKKAVDNKDSLGNVRVAASYINVKVKQNDTAGSVFLTDAFFGGKEALALNHAGEGEGFVTYIFYENGILYECLTRVGEAPAADTSFEIVPLEDFELIGAGSYITARFFYRQNGAVGKIDIIMNTRAAAA